MNTRYALILMVLIPVSVGSFAQKIVFTDDFNTKNIAYESAGGTRIVEDSTTGEKVFIYSGKKELLFYQLDTKWKLVHKVKKSPVRESEFSDPNFKVLKAVHNKDKWSFIVRSLSGCSKETIDFATEEFTVDRKFMEDINKKFRDDLFFDGDEMNILYLDKDNEINLLNFSADLSANNIKLSMSSSLPLGKTGKYNTADLYGQIEVINEQRARSPYFTRRKVQLYTTQNSYCILVAGEEPVVELTEFDRKTGRRLKSQLFQVHEMLPEGSRDARYNTAALLFNNKVHVLAANKSGGVYAVFDAVSKEALYHYLYNEKDNTGTFNYGPVLYETLPGTVNTAVLKEKVDDINMDKFCSELFKHSNAITARYMEDGRLLVTLANYDMKELAAGTAAMRNGLNTMTSSDWYVSASAGFIFDPGGWKISAKKSTWNELNNSDAGDKYKKVEYTQSSDADAEYNDKRSYIFKTQFIGNRRYTIYFTAGREIKIDEKILKNAPPKIVGFSD